MLFDGIQRVMLVSNRASSGAGGWKRSSRGSSRVQQKKIEQLFLQPDLKVELSLHGVSLSLVDSSKMREVALISMHSQGESCRDENEKSKEKKKTLNRDKKVAENTRSRKNTAAKQLVFASAFFSHWNFLSAFLLSSLFTCSKIKIRFIPRRSGAVWEQQTKEGARELLKCGHIAALESAYAEGGRDGKVSVEGWEYDVGAMRVHKPHFAHLHRFVQPAISCGVTWDDQYCSIEARLNHFQVDHQTPGAVYPVVVNCHAAQRSKMARLQPRPVVELAAVRHTNENLRFQHYKYVKLLVQEFDLRLNLGFVHDSVAVFAAPSASSSANRMQVRDLFSENR